MATVVSQHVRHLGFSKNVILRKTAASFTDICRQHIFTSSNSNIVENRA